jgi:hypothetical protein
MAGVKPVGAEERTMLRRTLTRTWFLICLARCAKRSVEIVSSTLLACHHATPTSRAQGILIMPDSAEAPVSTGKA